MLSQPTSKQMPFANRSIFVEYITGIMCGHTNWFSVLYYYCQLAIPTRRKTESDVFWHQICFARRHKHVLLTGTSELSPHPFGKYIIVNVYHSVYQVRINACTSQEHTCSRLHRYCGTSCPRSQSTIVHMKCMHVCMVCIMMSTQKHQPAHINNIPENHANVRPLERRYISTM